MLSEEEFRELDPARHPGLPHAGPRSGPLKLDFVASSYALTSAATTSKLLTMPTGLCSSMTGST